MRLRRSCRTTPPGQRSVHVGEVDVQGIAPAGQVGEAGALSASLPVADRRLSDTAGAGDLPL
jgi:hypothetical protein